MAKTRRRTRKKRSRQSRCQVMSIDVLPDDALLVIFDFCVDGDRLSKKGIEAWQSLVHVCRRWRHIVFGSPRRLNLRLACTAETPAKDTLTVWPALPLYIWCRPTHPTKTVDNIIAVLERRDCVYQITLRNLTSSQLEKVSAATQEPFPELTHLDLGLYGEIVPVLPDSFMGGSAPRLRFLRLDRIPFPGLPKLLFSTTHLAGLYLYDIPHSGYISPEAMITTLSMLTSLREVSLCFQSPQSLPARTSRHPPLPARSDLHLLTSLMFKGVTEYLEDLVACIDAPQLSRLAITFFNQILFDTPQLIQFIRRTLMLKALEKACFYFHDHFARVDLTPQTSKYRLGGPGLSVQIPCTELDWQVSSLEQVCTSCLPPLFSLEDLYIYWSPNSHPGRQDNIENTLWLELLHPLSAVKNLYLFEEVAPHIMSALQELVGAGALEVLPSLQNVFFEWLQPMGPVEAGIGRFAAARQVAGHPIAVSPRDVDWDL